MVGTARALCRARAIALAATRAFAVCFAIEVGIHVAIALARRTARHVASRRGDSAFAFALCVERCAAIDGCALALTRKSCFDFACGASIYIDVATGREARSLCRREH